ncbi:MAG: TetR/AcrR family transcriptional regulator [Rhizobiaceae bacterium]|nr:TetR/AcrR family transcriptional regulator [Rhizobiaceae bacterium]
MAAGRPHSRDKILAAAAEVAREVGPGNLSLDAVAYRAGVSKGGLLYNFPTKAKLMQALVQDYVTTYEAQLDQAMQGQGSLLAAHVALSAKECSETVPSAAGLLAVMAEDPDFLLPIKSLKRRLLDRLKSASPGASNLLIVFAALEGLRSMKLFDMDVFTDEERETLLADLLSSVGAARQS